LSVSVGHSLRAAPSPAASPDPPPAASRHRPRLAHLPAVRVSEADAHRVVHGVPIEAPPGTGMVRVLGPDGALLAIAELGKGARLSYRRVLVELDDNRH